MGSFKNKLLFSYIAYGISLLLVAMYALNGVSESNVKEHYAEQTVQKLIEQKTLFKQYTKKIERKLFAIRDSKIFKKYLNNGNYSDSVELFSYLTNTSTEIMQLRYLDKNGFEKIRSEERRVGKEC